MDKAKICGPRDGCKNAAHVAKMHHTQSKTEQQQQQFGKLALPFDSLREQQRARERDSALSAGALRHSKSTAAIHIDVKLVR